MMMQNIPHVDACPSAIVKVGVINYFYTQLATGISTKPSSKQILIPRQCLVLWWLVLPHHTGMVIFLKTVTGMFRTISMTDFETYVSTNVARSTCTKTYPYEYKSFIQELIYWPLLCIETRNDKHRYLIVDCELSTGQTNQHHSIVMKLVPVYNNMMYNG